MTTGLCATLLRHVFTPGPHSLDDWSPLLGMVNVATARMWSHSPISTSDVACTHRAFVVGVNAYSSPISSLKKCVQDAEDMKRLLGSKGYNVMMLPDASRHEFVTIFDAFCDTLTGASKVVVHFSGHGAAPAAESFLLAKDSTGTAAAPRTLIGCYSPFGVWRSRLRTAPRVLAGARESWIRVNWMLWRLHRAARNATVVLLLDCCRDERRNEHAVDAGRDNEAPIQPGKGYAYHLLAMLGLPIHCAYCCMCILSQNEIRRGSCNP